MKRSAYTLLELIVVLGILAIVLGVVLLKQTSLHQRELDVLMEDLRFARSYAVSQSRTVVLQFNTGTETYTISELSGAELIKKTLKTVDLKSLHFIPSSFYIYPSGAFSKCGHILLTHSGKPYKLNFTVGVARFTLQSP